MSLWDYIIQSIDNWDRRKDGGRKNLSLFPASLFSWDIHLFSCPRTTIYTIGSPGSPVFRLVPGLKPLAFLGLQLAESRSCDFSASIIIHEPFPYNKSFSSSLSLYILLVLLVWKTLTNTLVKGGQ